MFDDHDMAKQTSPHQFTDETDQHGRRMCSVCEQFVSTNTRGGDVSSCPGRMSVHGPKTIKQMINVTSPRKENGYEVLAVDEDGNSWWGYGSSNFVTWFRVVNQRRPNVDIANELIRVAGREPLND